MLRGGPLLDAVLPWAELAGKLWLKALQLTILPLVIGLVVAEIGVNPAEAQWVITRLAELMGWSLDA